MADREVSGVRTAIRGVVGAQSALRETQVEQSRALREIAEAVGVVLAGHQQQEQILASLAVRQMALSEAVGRHDDQFAEILRRLPPAP